MSVRQCWNLPNNCISYIYSRYIRSLFYSVSNVLMMEKSVRVSSTKFKVKFRPLFERSMLQPRPLFKFYGCPKMVASDHLITCCSWPSLCSILNDGLWWCGGVVVVRWCSGEQSRPIILRSRVRFLVPSNIFTITCHSKICPVLAHSEKGWIKNLTLSLQL